VRCHVWDVVCIRLAGLSEIIRDDCSTKWPAPFLWLVPLLEIDAMEARLTSTAPRLASIFVLSLSAVSATNRSLFHGINCEIRSPSGRGTAGDCLPEPHSRSANQRSEESSCGIPIYFEIAYQRITRHWSQPPRRSEIVSDFVLYFPPRRSLSLGRKAWHYTHHHCKSDHGLVAVAAGCAGPTLLPATMM
jgi:hypothetical protein